MEDNKIKYSISLADGRKTEWDEEQWNKGGASLQEKYPDAQITRTTAYDEADEQDGDRYDITLPDGRTTTWDSAQWAKGGKNLQAKYPDAQITTTRRVTAQPAQQTVAPVEAALETQETPAPAPETEIQEPQIPVADDTPLTAEDKERYSLASASKLEALSGVKGMGQIHTQNAQAYTSKGMDQAFQEKLNRDKYMTPAKAEYMMALEEEQTIRNQLAVAEENKPHPLLDTDRPTYEDKREANKRIDVLKAQLAEVEERIQNNDYYKTQERDNRRSLEYTLDAAKQGAEELAKDVLKNRAILFASAGPMAGAANVPNEEEYNNYMAAQRLSQEGLDMWDATKKGETSGIYDVVKAFSEGGLDEMKKAEFWDVIQKTKEGGSLYNLHRKILDVIGTYKGKNADEVADLLGESLTPSERTLLYAYFANSDAQTYNPDLHWAYKGGQSAAESAKFMAEFILFSGATGAIGDYVTEGLLKLVGKGGADVGMGIVSKALNWAADDVAALIQGGAQTLLAPGTFVKVAEDLSTINPATGELDKTGKVIAKSVLDSWVENATEFGAGPFNKILGEAEGAVLRGLERSGLNVATWQWTPGVKRFMNAAGMSGLVEEFGEEINGAVIRQLTHLDDNAWSEFWKKDNILSTLASFAVSIGGAQAVSNMQQLYNESALDKSGEKLAAMMKEKGYGEEEVDNFLAATGKRSMTQNLELIERLLQQNKGDEAFGKQVLDYLDKSGRVAGYDQAVEQERRIDRLAKQRELLDVYGNKQFWTDATDTAPATVDELVFNDGRRYIVTGEAADGTLAVFDSTGKQQMLDPAQLAHGLAVSEDSDAAENFTRRKITLNDYLDASVLADHKQAEQIRMNNQSKAWENLVRQKVAAPFKYGPDGVAAQVIGPIGPDGAIVQFAQPVDIDGETGVIHQVSIQRLGDLVGIPYNVQTEEQIESREAANKLNADRAREAVNDRARGKQIQLRGQTITLTKAVRNDNLDKNDVTYVTLLGRNESGAITTVAVPFTDIQEQVDALGDVEMVDSMQYEETKAEVDNTPRDFRGNALPLNANGSVNQNKLFDTDPEAWAKWNTEKNGEADTVNYLTTIALPRLQSNASQVEAQMLATADLEARDGLRTQLSGVQEQINKLTGILNGYSKAVAEGARQTRDTNAANLQKKFDEIADVPTNIVTLENFVQQMQADGCSQAQINAVQDKIDIVLEMQEYGMTGAVDGCHMNGKIYIFAEFSQKAEITYGHERQHELNARDPKLMQEIAGMATQQDLVGFVQALSGSTQYDRLNPEALADELIAFGLEDAGEEINEKRLRRAGVPDTIINKLKESYGERRIGSLRADRSGSTVSDENTAPVVGENGPAPEGESGPMAEQRQGPDGGSVAENEAGGEPEAVEEEVEPAEAEQPAEPEFRISEETRADLKKVGLVETSGLIMDPNHAKLKEITGYQTPNERDLDADQVRFSLTTLKPWGTHYLHLPNSEARVVEALNRWAERAAASELVSGVISQGVYSYNPPKSGTRAKGSPVGPLRTNVEYVITFDMDTTCPRTFEYLNLSKKIEKNIGRPLTQRECIQLIELMRMNGQQIPCVYCYAENKRQLMKQYYTDFIEARNGVLGAKTKVEALAAMYGHKTSKTAKESEDPKVALTEAAAKVFEVWWKDRAKLYNPSISELWTGYQASRNAALSAMDLLASEKQINQRSATETIAKKVAERFGGNSKRSLKVLEDIAEEWKWDTIENRPHLDFEPVTQEDMVIRDEVLDLWREMTGYAKSASSAKNVDRYVPYTDELRYISQEDRDYINGMGGLRMHSTNDFRIDYVLDYLQFMADMAEAGMMGHTYTKSEDFVRIFGNSGYKINMSIAAYEDEDGNIAENSDEGFDWRIARELRELYPNAGVMLMATSDAQIQLALDSDWIDMFIPFHASGLPTVVWKDMRAWQNYTGSQNEGFYNADQMKERLDAAGIQYDKNLKDQELEDFFCETFNIHREFVDKKNNKGEIVPTRIKPHFLPGPTKVEGVDIPGWHKPGATEEEDIQEYLRLCNEWGVNPRFYNVMVKDQNGNQISLPEHPKYIKCIKETARMDTPQTPIHFDFDKPSEDPTLHGMSPMDWALDQLEKAAIREKNMAGEAVRDIYESTKKDAFGLEKQFMDTVIKHKEETGEDLPYDYVPEASKETFKILHEAYYEIYPELRPGYVPYHDNTYDENGVQMRITEQEDAEYMQAVEAGDMEKAQQMVADAFKAAYPNNKLGAKIFYKGKNGDWGNQVAGYFTDDFEFADHYGAGEVKEFFLNMENPYEYNFEGSGSDGDYEGWDGKRRNTYDIMEKADAEAKEKGLQPYDGYILRNVGEYSWPDSPAVDDYITRDTKNVKSADPVTYDNDGKVIPLSQRFDPESNDVRFRTTYHGSGAIFDKFDTRFMSTGEGNQAYGWGTYVTTNQETGRKYAEIASATETGGFKPGATSKDIIAAQIYGIMDRDPLKSFDDAKRELKEEWADDRYTAEDLDSFLESDLGKYGPRQLYTVEIPDDNGENYLHWDKPITRSQSKKIIDGIKAQIGDRLIEEYGDEKSVDYELKSALGYGTEGSRVEGALDYFFGNEMNYATGENPGAERNSKFLNSLGIVGMEIPIDRNGGQRYKGSNYVIYNTDDAVISDRVSFRMENNNQRMFISNAERAVEGLNMGKAAPAAWLKAIQGRGGLKAGEDKWLGLSDWLNASDKKSITKEELLDYIRENQIQIEEVHYTDGGDFTQMDNIYPGFSDAFELYMDMDREYYVNVKDKPAAASLYEKYGTGIVPDEADEKDYVEMAYKMLQDNMAGVNIINPTRMEYTTQGLTNKREIALTVPTIEPWNTGDSIHFGDAGNGRTIAWIRFGETNARPTYDQLMASLESKYGAGKVTDNITPEEWIELINAKRSPESRVLVIDEIQSKRHQEGRDKGYAASGKEEAQRQLESFIETMKEKYQGDDYSWADNASSEDLAEYDRLLAQRNGTITGVPDAPFEKNWHELAMKRMLRLAAEEGYDYVAWTKGEQQAERYSIGGRVREISSNGWDDGVSSCRVISHDGETLAHIGYRKDGTITFCNEQRDYIGKNLRDVLGKEYADAILSKDHGIIIKPSEMRLGGEGMKGFYDDILPRFMNKYGKGWGVKTQDIVLPNVESAGEIMHAVPVTEAMKESVMQGQVMFRTAYHGSGADFDRFDSSHVGEGEGAAAHGYGTYVAFQEETGSRYARTIGHAKWKFNGPEGPTSYTRDVVDQIVSDMTFNGEKANPDFMIKRVVKYLESRIKEGAPSEYWEGAYAQMPQELEYFKSLKPSDFEFTPERRSLYTVEVPDDTGKNYIVEDKKVPDAIIKKVNEALLENPVARGKIEVHNAEVGREEKKDFMGELSGRHGRTFYMRLAEILGKRGTYDEKAASELLNSIGIVGIKYDGMRDGECAVIFNDNDLEITDHVRFRSVEITPETRQEMDVIKATTYVNGTFMKAPNGADTKLNEEQWLMVRTKAFKAWFGDWENDPENASKVVDPETGEPMVVWHAGTFANGSKGSFVPWDEMHFGTMKAAMDRSESKLRDWFFPVYASLGKDGKYRWELEGYEDVVDEDSDEYKEYTRLYESQPGYDTQIEAENAGETVESMLIPNYGSAREGIQRGELTGALIEDMNYALTPVFLNIRNMERVEDMGSDWNYFYINHPEADGAVYTNEYEDIGSDSYMVMSANQVKSADNNNGEFGPGNGDIRFRTRETYQEYMTPEAREKYAEDKRFVESVHKDLAFLSAASRAGAKIPGLVLMEEPKINAAQAKLDAVEGKLEISDVETEALATKLLDDAHGSAVFENGKILKIDKKEIFTGPVKQERLAMFIVGRPAAGKSSVYANRLSNEHQARIIDSDVVKPWLDGFEDGDGAGYVQDASTKVADRALEIAVENGDNIIIPKIGGKSMYKMALNLKKKGYTLQLYMNDVSEGSSIMRAMARFSETGRFLNLNYLMSIGEKPKIFFTTFANASVEEAENLLYGKKENTVNSGTAEDLRGGRETREGVLRTESEGRREAGVRRGRSGEILLDPLFEYAEWKNNEVPFGSDPELIWSSDSDVDVIKLMLPDLIKARETLLSEGREKEAAALAKEIQKVDDTISFRITEAQDAEAKITYDNFFEYTKADYKQVNRPKGEPDYVSRPFNYGFPTEEVSSEYWYGSDEGGDYVVRGSDHWSHVRKHYGKWINRPGEKAYREQWTTTSKIGSCEWTFTPDDNVQPERGRIYGKAYLSDFEPLSFRITEAQDAEYMDAVNSGDMEKAQQMVDAAAEQWGKDSMVRGERAFYTPNHNGPLRKMYHGTQAYGFNVFNTNPHNNNVGSHFGSEYAAGGFRDGEYGAAGENPGEYKVYLDIKNPLDTFDWFGQDDAYPLIAAEGVIEKMEEGEAKEEAKDLLSGMLGLPGMEWATGDYETDYDNVDGDIMLDNKADEGPFYDSIRRIIELAGYDGISYINDLEDAGNYDYIAFYPEQIKLADPVTYDDNGKVIPLSERFNPENNDVRFRTSEDSEAIEEQQVRYRVIDDAARVAELEAGPKVKGKIYRAMQLVDGKLYPPMSAREKVEYVTKNGKTRTRWQWRTPIELGKWEQSEEHPELANEDGTFTLDKGNGSTVNAAYNPYFHTSRTPLNDQFASAWNRPELVTVEVEVPESELNGDYKAEKAKDSVGEKEWKAGVVQGQLTGTRKVILTRYDKPVRIVPDSEAADEIVKMFGDRDVEIPFNVVNESLRNQLVKRGVKIGEPAKGNAGDSAMQAYEDWKDQQGDVRLRISEQPGLSLDLMETHDQIQQNGLDSILSNVDIMDIYSALPESIRVQINGEAIRNGYNFAGATKQYFARLAEKVSYTDEEKAAIDAAINTLEDILGMPVLSEDALWMFYQDQHRNDRDPLDILHNVITADMLGFSPQAIERKENLDREARLRTVNNQYDATAADYYSTSLGFHAAINESLKDQFESVNKLVEAIEKTSGKKAKAFEDVRLALNQLSSKNFADKNVYLRDYLKPMWDVVRTMAAYSPTGIGKQRIVRAATLEDIVKYVCLKHGLERNDAFAKRDAIEAYRKEYEAQVDEIKRDDSLTQDEKDKQIDAAERVFEANKAMVNAGQASKYLENREKDYSGIMAWFYHQPARRPKRLPNEGRDSYMKRLMKLRQPMFDLLDDAEQAAQQYIDDFEARMTVPASAVANLAKQRGTVKLNGETKLTDLLWDRINAATKETLRHQREAGMITQATYDNLAGMFQYYVPLRGFKEDAAEDVYAYYHDDAENSFSAPVLHAKGRRSMSDNPFGVIGQMAESAIQQDNKNKAKQTLYLFVSDRADNGLAELSKVWLSTTGEVDASGRVVWKKHYPKLTEGMSQDEIAKAWQDLADEMADLAMQGVKVRQGIQGLDIKTNFVKMDDKSMPEHFVNVMVNGQDYDIIVNSSPRAAQAIAGKFNIESGDNLVWKAILQIQRQFSALATSMNPEFGITNFFRDLMFADLSTWVEHGTGFAAKYHANLMKLLMGAKVSRLNADYNKPDLQSRIEKNHPDLVALWKEYVENGGPTGYTVLTDNKEYDKKMDQYLKDQLAPAAVRGIKKFFSWISQEMESIEQIGRFAAYITSRQMGESVIDAVNAAKEATLNFNRKGSGKMMTPKDLKSFTFSDEPALAAIQKASVYALTTFAPLRGTMMFFNAAVQSFAKWLKMWGMAPGKMALNAAWNIALAFGLALLHAGGDDDDDEYLDQAIYERRSALLLGRKRPFVKIPISQEMVPYFAIGDILATEVVLKKYPNREPVREIVEAFGELLPLNPVTKTPGREASTAFAAFSPLIDLASNKNFYGASIRPEKPYMSEGEKEVTPKYEYSYDRTAKWAKETSKILNDLTNGKGNVAAGWLNPSPENIEYLVSQTFKGTGTFLDRVVKSIEMTADIATDPEKGIEDIDLKSVPFVSRLVVDSGDDKLGSYTAEVYNWYTRDLLPRMAALEKRAKDKYKSDHEEEIAEKKAQAKELKDERTKISNKIAGLKRRKNGYLVSEMEELEKQKEDLTNKIDALESWPPATEYLPERLVDDRDYKFYLQVSKDLKGTGSGSSTRLVPSYIKESEDMIRDRKGQFGETLTDKNVEDLKREVNLMKEQWVDQMNELYYNNR